tara:strand:+ start:22 stop:438 length:417 start_codon:yes stop_codon:yes gene_type:complete
MEKINLEKAREHLAALNTELGVKTFDKDVIERLSGYIDDYIHRKMENITMHDHITDCEFSINYNKQVELDDFNVDSDDIARELSAYDALEYAIDRYEAEEEAKKEKTRVNPEPHLEAVEKVIEQLNPENKNNTEQNGG